MARLILALDESSSTHLTQPLDVTDEVDEYLELLETLAHLEIAIPDDESCPLTRGARLRLRRRLADGKSCSEEARDRLRV